MPSSSPSQVLGLEDGAHKSWKKLYTVYDERAASMELGTLSFSYASGVGLFSYLVHTYPGSAEATHP